MKLMILAFILGLASLAFGQGSLSTKVSPKSKPAAKAWSLSTKLSSSTDLQVEPERRPYTHAMDLAAGYKLPENFSVSASTRLEMIADGQNIRKETGNPAWDDLTFSGNWEKSVFSNSQIELGVSESLPTGNESRLEQVKSVLGGSAGIVSTFIKKRLAISNYVTVSKLFQTYEYSVTTLESNPDMVSTYQLGFSYAFVSNWRISLAGRAASVRFINGENQLKTSVVEGISYSRGNFRAQLSYVMGTYDENDSYRLMYLDDTKRIVVLGVSFEI